MTFETAFEKAFREVPDLEILSEAEIQSAIEMAREAIGLKGISMEDAGEEIPKATEADKIEASAEMLRCLIG